MRQRPSFLLSSCCVLAFATAVWLGGVRPTAAQVYNGVLVVGVPDYDASASITDSGAVAGLHTFEGTGVSGGGSQYLTQSSYGFDDSPDTLDSLGQALAVGDFNGDGLPDVAIGIPFEDIGAVSGAGMVQVVYTYVFGFVAYDSETLHHDVPDILGDPCTNCKFGSALAAGDFNGDGFDDLAVGSPEYYMGSMIGDAGAVNVIYGSADGFVTLGNQFWTQDSPDILDDAEDYDRFGAVLAAGDFDGDGYDDLVIAAPYERVGSTASEAGAINVLYGTSLGLSASRNQLWTQGNGLAETPEAYDHFGAALAVGDFNGSGIVDLAVGAPGESVSGASNSGVVHIISGWGAGQGLVSFNDELWSQDSPGMQDESEDNDRFGAALAAGDFNGDGYDDLAVGAPLERIFDGAGVDPELWVFEGGQVQIIFGSSSYLDVVGNLRFNEAIVGVLDEPDDDEHFGAALAAADFDGDGYADLAVGVPGEDPDGVVDAGAFHVFYGSPSGPSTDGTQLWHLGSTDVSGTNQADAAFGTTLVAMNWRSIFADSFEHGTTGKWSSVQ